MLDENSVTYLKDSVKQALSDYFEQMEDHEPSGLYKLFLEQVEIPLLEFIMKQAKGNQVKAARILGINRGTLRKKLEQYVIN